MNVQTVELKPNEWHNLLFILGVGFFLDYTVYIFILQILNIVGTINVDSKSMLYPISVNFYQVWCTFF